MMEEGTREQLGVWTAEGCGFVKVFVKTCPHVITGCEEKKSSFRHSYKTIDGQSRQ